MPYTSSDIVVTRDPFDDLIANCLLIEPYKHFVLEKDPYASFLNRECGRKDLFLYHHKHTGNMVLAAHTARASGYDFATELTTFSSPPGWWDSDFPDLKIVKLILRPAIEKAQEAMRRIRQATADKKAGRIENRLAALDMAHHLKQKGMIGTAKALEAGVPFLSAKQGGDHLAETQERLVGMLPLEDRKPGPRYDHLFNPSTPPPTPAPAPIATPAPSIITP